MAKSSQDPLGLRTEGNIYVEETENAFNQKITKTYFIKSYFRPEGLRSPKDSQDGLLSPSDDCNIFQNLFYKSLEPKVPENPLDSLEGLSPPGPSLMDLEPKVPKDPKGLLTTSSFENPLDSLEGQKTSKDSLWKKEAYEIRSFAPGEAPGIFYLYKVIQYSPTGTPIISTTYSGGMNHYQVVQYDALGYRTIKRWYDENHYNFKYCTYQYKDSEGISGTKILECESHFKNSKDSKSILSLKIVFKEHSSQEGPPKTSKESKGFSGTFGSKDSATYFYYDECGELTHEVGI